MLKKKKKMTSIDLHTFNTSKVTTMKRMFKNCLSLEKLDVSNFDTLKVTDMEEMFNTIPKLKSLDLSSFNTMYCLRFSNIFEGNDELKINIKKDVCSNILTGLPAGVEVVDVS